MSRYIRFIDLAACHGADPKLFDAITEKEAEPALEYCRRCTVVDECYRQINPYYSFFTGVAAGKVWASSTRRRTTP